MNKQEKPHDGMVDEEKFLNKIQHLFLIKKKMPSKLGIYGNFFWITRRNRLVPRSIQPTKTKI